MKKRFHRLTAFALSVVLIMSELSVPVFAAPVSEENTETVQEETVQAETEQSENTEDTAVESIADPAESDGTKSAGEKTDDTKGDAVENDSDDKSTANESANTGSEQAEPQNDEPENENIAEAEEDIPQEDDELASSEDPEDTGVVEKPDGFKFVPGYVPAPNDDKYESPIEAEGFDEDELLDNLDPFYVSDAVVGKASRSQGNYGTCWAFATMAAAESAACAQGLDTKNIDLSELHLAYFVGKKNMVYDPLGGLDGDSNGVDGEDFLDFGGAVSNSVNILMNWTGAASESKYPYSSARKNYSLNKQKAIDDHLHLRSFYFADPTTDRNSVKQLIKEYGAVSVAYYAADEDDDGGSGYLEADLYDKSNNCYYTPKDVGFNHAVAIVGWDDNFSKNKFVKTPSGNGAWLIRNSWATGNTVDEKGRVSSSTANYNSYFWLSYYDKTIYSGGTFALEMDEADNYKNNYQYDGSMLTDSRSGATKYANVFTAKADETLAAVYFATQSAGVKYQIDVYTGVTGNDPTNGTHEEIGENGETSVSGKTTYAGGHTIDLGSAVGLTKGEKFSVVVTVPSNTKMDFECTSDEVYITTAHTESGRGYVYSGGWKDITKFNSGRKDLGDLRIKAFTTDKPIPRVTINMDANGGKFSDGSTNKSLEVIATKTYASLTTLTKPARDGYEFDGWYDKKSGGNRYNDSAAVESAKTIYAHWIGKQYKVTLNPNGGKFGTSTANKTITVTFGEKYGDLPEPSMNGYDFYGWVTADDTPVNANTIVSSENLDISQKTPTLYATWTASKYEVTLDPTGGACDGPTKITVTYNEYYPAINAAKLDGCDFDGWYTAKTGGTKVTTSTKVTQTQDHTLYARWKGKSVTVSYDPNGGNCTAKPKTVKFNAKYGSLPSATRAGYKLGGWCLDLSDIENTKVTANDLVTTPRDHTLYAFWNPNEYQVIFDAMGGVCTTDSKMVYYDGKYGQLPAPTKLGYTLAGWFTSASGGDQITNDSDVTILAKHTLYAHWTPNSYKVKFDPNGGKIDGSAAVKEVSNFTYRTAYGASLPVGTRVTYDNNHVFLGWFTEKENGKGIKITENSIFTFTDNDQTLYAHWSDWGDVDGSDKTDANNISGDNIWIGGVPATTPFTSEQIKFDDLIKVYKGDKRLTKDVDYTLSYKNNIKVGIATITITGKGNFSGKTTKDFEITKINLEDGNAKTTDISLLYNGKVQKGTTTVYYTFDNGKTITLKKGTDYDYPKEAYENVSANPGEYEIPVLGKGNFTGTIIFKEKILDKNDSFHMISKAAISIKPSTRNATGEAVKYNVDDDYKIIVTSKDGKETKTLVEETDHVNGDYKLEYRNNILPGTATVIVQGLEDGPNGDFYGTKTATFKINAKPISKATVTLSGNGYDLKTNSFTYTGAPIEPGMKLSYAATKKDNPDELTVWSDTTPTGSYTVDGYMNNVNAGKNKACVTITGHGDFSGTTKKTFTINPVSFDSSNEGDEIGNVEFMLADNHTGTIEIDGIDWPAFGYQKGGTRPKVKVVFHGLDANGAEVPYELVEGKDFAVTYGCNNAVTTSSTDIEKIPYFVITGKGNFTGSSDPYGFAIAKAGKDDVKVNVDDVVFKGKPGNYVPKITITDTGGKTLAANTDYDKNIVYSVAAGTKVTDKNGAAIDGVTVLDSKVHVVPAGTTVTASVTLKNNYEASEPVTATFRVVKSSMSSVNVKIKDQAYTGKDIYIGYDDILSIKSGKYDLDPGDYVIENRFVNISKGTGKVLIRGRENGNFGGSKIVTFKIVNRSF